MAAAPGELWSLNDREVVVCLTHDAGASRPDIFIATIVSGLDDDPFWEHGRELVVHASALCQQWTVKPLTGVAREPTP